MAPMGGQRSQSRANGRRAGKAAVAVLARPSLAVALLIAGLLLAVAFVAIAAQRNALARDAAALQAQIVAEEARHAQLESAVKDMATDGYVEQKAREFGYIRPGEAIIGVQREGPAPVLLRAAQAGPTRLEMWVALFLGKR